MSGGLGGKTSYLRVKALAALRGGVNPILVRLTRPRDYDVRRSLVISGFPRSGTTWLAELLATVPGTGILFEPLNPVRVPAARRAGCDWQNFRTSDEAWPKGERFMQQVLVGRILNAWTTVSLPVSRAWRVSRWIVKLVNSNAMLPWLVSRFDILPPVMLVRHPCAVYSSWTRRGWPALLHPPFEESRFYERYPRFLPVVRRLKHPEEYFAALWCVDHYAAFHEPVASRYELCIYERLITDGTEEVRRLLEGWAVPAPASLDTALARPSAKASEDLQAGSRQQLGTWQRHLRPVEVSRMVDVLREFGIEFYGPNPEPDYGKVPQMGVRS